MYLTTHAPRYCVDRQHLERHCQVEFVKGSGPGGQHRNKRQTGVRLRHPDSGLVVMATERRSQTRNRALAFERLIERLEALNDVDAPRQRWDHRPAAVDAARLERKRRRAGLKAQRARRLITES